MKLISFIILYINKNTYIIRFRTNKDFKLLNYQNNYYIYSVFDK
jgi:hypothetical protein